MDQNNNAKGNGRRWFLQFMSGSALMLASYTAMSPESKGNSQSASTDPKEEEEVSPAEDLMREHEAMMDRVATIEKTLGIFDLAQYTPKGLYL
jgi:hypothetical protein